MKFYLVYVYIRLILSYISLKKYIRSILSYISLRNHNKSIDTIEGHIEKM